MNTPIICPHCHSLLDPSMLETAVSATARYQICPECDRPIGLFSTHAEEMPADAVPSDAFPVDLSLLPIRAAA